MGGERRVSVRRQEPYALGPRAVAASTVCLIPALTYALESQGCGVSRVLYSCAFPKEQ